MTALLIGPEERVAIAKLRLLAEANPFDPQRVIEAAERDMAAYRAWMDGLSITLPSGYWVTYSHEDQPCGRCHHISISVDRPNKMPHPEAVQMILREFEMKPIGDSLQIWIEHVSPTVRAVNIMQAVS
jgi:hypothetical protein